MASDSSNSISVSPCSPLRRAATRAISRRADRARHCFASVASFNAASLMAVPSGASTATSTQNDFKAPFAGAGRDALRRSRLRWRDELR